MRPHLRLLTANLLNGRADPARFAELLQRLGVDIACLQELSPAQAEAIETALPHGKLDPRHDHEGAGIALRHPAEVERLPLPQRDARVARLEPGHWPRLDATLEVLGVHLQAPHAKPPPWRNLPTRRAQLQALVEYVESAPVPHRVVAGDFNATPLWPLYRRLREHFHDLPAQFANRRGRRPRRTWGPLALGGVRLLRIDHVFASGVDALGVELHPIPGSDHAALVVDLDLP